MLAVIFSLRSSDIFGYAKSDIAALPQLWNIPYALGWIPTLALGMTIGWDTHTRYGIIRKQTRRRRTHLCLFLLPYTINCISTKFLFFRLKTAIFRCTIDKRKRIAFTDGIFCRKRGYGIRSGHIRLESTA